MSDVCEVIFDRVRPWGVTKVEVETGVQREEFKGTLINVHREGELPLDFFFPDYAGMTDDEMAEVVANNLRVESWNSLMP